MKKIFLCLWLLLLFQVSCVSTKEKNIVDRLDQAHFSKKCESIRQFFLKDLDQYQSAVDGAAKSYQEEQWRVESADPTASLEKLSIHFAVLQKMIYQKGILESIKTLEIDTRSVREEECGLKRSLKRAKELLESTIITNDLVIQKEKENQDLQDALQNKSNAFRLLLPGEREPVSRALYLKKLGTTESRSQREALYKLFNAARAQKWEEWNFKALVRARNDEAKLAGFENYYTYRFFRNQLDFNNYRSLLEEIKTRFAPRVRNALSELGLSLGISQVEGWDIRYIREKASAGHINEFLKQLDENSALSVARDFYTGLGISIDQYQFPMDLYPRPGKNTHAFAMSLVFPHVNLQRQLLPTPQVDIRFLANLKKPVLWGDIGTLIHELAHAIHAAEVRQPLSLFRGTGSVETEAIAMTTERMADSAEFLELVIPKYTGVTAKNLQSVSARHVKAAQTEQAIVLLRQIFFSDYEYQIYVNPEQDFAELWSKLHKEYWGVDVGPFYADWDIDHFLSAPVYVQNYAIGILMVEQIYQSILKEFKTSFQSKALGDKIKKVYFEPGLEFNYLDLTEKFTGKPLSTMAVFELVK